MGVSQPAPLFEFTEEAGQHEVGLKVVEQYDCARVFRPATNEFGQPTQGERTRPLQTLIWYPAEPVATQTMTVGDYGNLWASETRFGNPRPSAHAKE